MLFKRSLFLFLTLFFLFSVIINGQQITTKTATPEKKPAVNEELKSNYTATIASLDAIMKKAEPIIEKSRYRLKIFTPVLEKIKKPVPDNLTIEVNSVVMSFDKADLIKQNCELALSLGKKITEKTTGFKTEESTNTKLILDVYGIDQSLSTLTRSSVEGDFEKMQEWIRLPELLEEKTVILNGKISSLKAELELNATSEDEVNTSIKTRKANNLDFLIFEQKNTLLSMKKDILNQIIKHNTVLIKIFKTAIENSKKSIALIQNSEFYKKALFENEKNKKLLLEKKLLVEKQKMETEKAKLEKESKKAQKALNKIQSKTSGLKESPSTREILRIAEIKVKNAQLQKDILELKQQIRVAKLEEKNDKLSTLQLLADIEKTNLSEKEIEKKKKEIETRLDNLESNIKLIEENTNLFSKQLEITRNTTEEIQLKESSIAAKKDSTSKKYRKVLQNSLKFHNLNCELLQKKISQLVEKKQVLKKNLEILKKFKTQNIVYKFFGNSKVQYRNFFLVLFGGFLLSFIVRSIIKRSIIKIFQKTKYKFDELIAASLNGPISMAVIVAGTYAAFTMLDLSKTFEIRVNLFIESLIIINATYLFMRVVNIISFFLEKLVTKTETKLDDQLLPIIRKTVKALLFIGGFTILLENMGYKVTSLLTGLGIGGLAIALAAKDSLSNFFGSIMIFTDKPFVIGDWVIFTGYEGIIEDIGLRSTKVRTWKDTLVTIPNSVVAAASIENVTRWNARRVCTTLKLRMDTPPEKMDLAVNCIRKLLDDRKDVNDGHYIFYNNIDEYSHNIMIYYFAATTVWRDYLNVRQEVFIEILQTFQKHGICLALPAEIKADTTFGETVEYTGNNQV